MIYKRLLLMPILMVQAWGLLWQVQVISFLKEQNIMFISVALRILLVQEFTIEFI